MPRNIVVLGPPGTGKSESCLTVSRGWFKDGCSTSQVAYLAFTKAAAKEAAIRISDGEVKEEAGEVFPFFRTLHSLAYRGLRQERPDVRTLTTPDMKAFSKWSSFEGAFSIEQWEDLSDTYSQMAKQGRTEWDDCLTAYTLSRVTSRTPQDLEAARVKTCVLANERIGVEGDVYKAFVEKYEAFKKSNGLVDFTDMLAHALTRMKPLDQIKYAVIDECLPSGTPVTMQDGTCKAIEDVTCGDIVWGYKDGEGLTPARVIETRQTTTQRLVRINGCLDLTPNHPIFIIGKGYVRADNVQIGDSIVTVDVHHVQNNGDEAKVYHSKRSENLLKKVWREISEISNAYTGLNLQKMRCQFSKANLFTNQSILFKDLFSATCDRNIQELFDLQCSDETSWERDAKPKVLFKPLLFSLGQKSNKEKNGSSSDHPNYHLRRLRQNDSKDRKAKSWRPPAILQREMFCAQEIHCRRTLPPIKKDEAFKSNVERRSSHKNEGLFEGYPASSTLARWEWSWPNKTTKSSFGKTGIAKDGLVSGVYDSCPWCTGLEKSNSRSSASKIKNRHRSRRSKPSDQEAKDHRCQKRGITTFVGMESLEVQKSNCNGELAASLIVDRVRSIEELETPSIPVFNIGTTTENYFAKNILVHNCQDLAPILHSIVDRLFQSANEVWWAGDDDQCIFSFSAADSNLFIERARKAYARIFLRQTHRFGPEVVDFSQKIIHRVRNRVEKEVIGLQGREHVIRGTNSFQPTVGEMMILHRHVMGCQALAQAYIGAGLPFRNERGKNPLGASVRLNAYRSLRALADGGEVSFGSVARFVEELMPSMGVEKDEKVRFVVHGAKKKMQDGDYKGKVNLQSLVSAKILTEQGADLVRLKRFQFMKHKDDLEYYDRVVENGYDLEGPAPIITTMHGAKGRQSDRVIVFTETGGKCWEDPDTEHKLAYVAATRTKRELEICGERTLEWASYPYDYPLEENQR